VPSRAFPATKAVAPTAPQAAGQAPLQAALPVLLLPAAIPDSGFSSDEQRAACSRLPGLVALATHATVAAESWSDATTPAEMGHEHWMRHQAGLARDESPSACSGITDRVPSGAWRVDPVHLRLGTDHLVLTDPSLLALEASDALALADAITPCVDEAGFTLLTPGSGRWYLLEREATGRLDVEPRSLLAAIGRSIDAYLPIGRDARRWKRLLNMIQMTWFEHPVNEAREARGLPAVNGLWLDGRCPSSDARREAIAALVTTSRSNASNTSPMVVDARLLEARLAGDPSAWLHAWRALDGSVLAEIAAFDGRWRDGARVVLAGDTGWREVRIGPRRGWRPRWWPRRGAASAQALIAAGGEPSHPGSHR
jgi:hypothetical protein